MIDHNQYIQRLREGETVEIMYDPFGEPSQFIFRKQNCTTCVPKGNDNFEKIESFLAENYIEPEFNVNWVKIIEDQSGKILHYITDKGSFTDQPENKITQKIRDGISSGTLTIQKADLLPATSSIEISIFLSRKYTFSASGPSKIDSHKFNGSMLGLPFEIDIELLQKIEPEYFERSEFLKEFLKHTDNNLVRLFITPQNIKKLYNWSKQNLDYELEYLEKSIDIDFALHKREKSRGPRTSWYFSWDNMQNYLWVLILHITNKVIGLMNMQAHRKSTNLLNKDEIGDITCLKINLDNGQSHLGLLSTLKDSQINIFPQDFFWDYRPVDIAFKKVRFLIDQGLYFESVVVAQAILESIVNGMFPPSIIQSLFGVRELKWKQKYKLLRSYFNDILLENSSLRNLLNGGLSEIYKYRNTFSHDYLEHQPDYEFDIKLYNQVKILLTPLTDIWENQKFMTGVSQMYEKRGEYLTWLSNKSNNNST